MTSPPDDGFEWMGPFSDGSYIRGRMKQELDRQMRIERIALPQDDVELIERTRWQATKPEPQSNDAWGWLIVAAAFAMALLLAAGYFDGSAKR